MSTEAMALVATGAPRVDADNPWPGLLSFSEQDTAYFKGRDHETEDLLRLVIRERLTVFFGVSGLGKSSLLQAGLFPRLRPENIFPVYIRLDFSAPTPDLAAQVFSTITREAERISNLRNKQKVEAPAVASGEKLWEYFHRQGNNFWNERNRPLTPALVFDQFEEIFTLGRQDGNRKAASGIFLEQLADLVEGRPPAELKTWIDEHPAGASTFDFDRHYYKVLLGIREDYLPELENLRARMPRVALNRLRLRRMNGEAALLVVNQAKHLFDATDPEQNIPEKVVRFVAADQQSELKDLQIEPALLSVFCSELNNKRKENKQDKITLKLLQGSQQQVIANFYERSTGDLAPNVRTFIEDHLLTVSGFRDSVALENAVEMGISEETIKKIVDRRLVRQEDRSGSKRLELTHDLLVSVVRASRDKRRQREAAEKEKAAFLAEQERQKQALLKAQEEERLRIEKAQEDEKRERERREARRSRNAATVFLALMLIAAGAAAWAFLAQKKAVVEEKKAQESEQAVKSQLDQIKRQQDEIATKQTALGYVIQQAAGPRPRIVLYRQPTDQLLPALSQLGYREIQVLPQQSNPNLQTLPVDTLVYGCGVTSEDIRTIAVALSGAGLPIRRITAAQRKPDPHLVQLIASAPTNAMNLSPMTLDQIKGWNRPDKPCAS
jgi:type II secretory pathway pseudopilin PulG